METEMIDKLFLELSQVTNAETEKEKRRTLALAGAIKALERIANAETLEEAVKEAKSTKRRLGRGFFHR